MGCDAISLAVFHRARHACGAVAAGAIAQSDIDRAVRRYWRTMMRLGMFDPMEQQPMVTRIGIADVDTAAGDRFYRRSGAAAFRSTFYFQARVRPRPVPLPTGRWRSRTTVAKCKTKEHPKKLPKSFFFVFFVN
jgi:hypothetical protein